MSTQATLSAPRLGDIVGIEHVLSNSIDLFGYAVDGVAPKFAACPGTAQEVAELVKFAAAENLAIIPTGARTKLGIGMPPTRYDLAIDVTRLDHVISYDPGDLTLSVEPGIPLARLATVLAEHSQFLPLDVPFYERATVGGTLASGVDSSLRQLYGTPRDFALGMEFVTGEGALVKSGGRVVKNVTGYDLHKLLLGSIGSLGIITRINFKTFPLPAQTATFIASFPSINAASAFNLAVQRSPLRCLRIEILSSPALALINAVKPSAAPNVGNWESFLVAVSVAGSNVLLARCERELQTAAQSITNGPGDFSRVEGANEQNLWTALRELTSNFAATRDAAILKLSCLPSEFTKVFDQSVAVAAKHSVEMAHLFRGCGVCYLILRTRDGASSAIDACCSELLHFAESAGPSATIPWCAPELKRKINIWGPPREDFPLMQQVKRAFDSQNIFAAGRFVGGL